MCVRMVIRSIFTTMALYLFLLTSCTLPQSHSHQPPPPPPVSNYSICKDSSYNCGNVTGIYYPFWGKNRPSYCGGGDMFNLKCHNDLNTTTILISSQNFTVLAINPVNYTMILKRTADLNVCSPQQFDDAFLIRDLFEYPTTSSITIFYNCSIDGENFFSCRGGGGQQHDDTFIHVGVVDDVELKEISERYRCERHVNVSVGFSLKPKPYSDDHKAAGIIDHASLERGLDEGFELKYDVYQSCIYCLGKEEEYCPWTSSTSVDFDTEVHSSCYYCSNGPNVPRCRPAIGGYPEEDGVCHPIVPCESDSCFKYCRRHDMMNGYCDYELPGNCCYCLPFVDDIHTNATSPNSNIGSSSPKSNATSLSSVSAARILLGTIALVWLLLLL